MSDLKHRETAAYRALALPAAVFDAEWQPSDEPEKWLKLIAARAASAIQNHSLNDWQISMLVEGERQAARLRTRAAKFRCTMTAVALALLAPDYFPVLWQSLAPLRQRGVLRLEELREFLIHLKIFPANTPPRRMERWATRHKISSVYRVGRRGHYRVRIDAQFCWWLLVVTAIHLADVLWDKFYVLYENRKRLADIGVIYRQIAGLGLNEKIPLSFRLCDIPPQAWNTPIDRQALYLLAATTELDARGEKVTADSVATLLGIPYSSFYRKGWAKRLPPRSRPPPAAIGTKDSRAKNLYKNQVLQETNTEE